MTQKVNNFRFINFAKQYIHFLKQFPENILQEHGISARAWGIVFKGYANK